MSLKNKVVTGANATVYLNGKKIAYASGANYSLDFDDFVHVWLKKYSYKAHALNKRLTGEEKPVSGYRAAQDLCKLLWKLGLKL
jgi:hypothetical protein